MRRSSFLFFKGLGLLFAILCGIGTAVLGWFDGADWMNIAAYSIAVTGLILWGWYHFSVRWINEDLKQNIFTKFPKKEIVPELPVSASSNFISEAEQYVQKNFPNNYGEISKQHLFAIDFRGHAIGRRQGVRR